MKSREGGCKSSPSRRVSEFNYQSLRKFVPSAPGPPSPSPPFGTEERAGERRRCAMVTRFAWAGHPSPRSCLTGQGRRTRSSLRRFRHALSQRLIASPVQIAHCTREGWTCPLKLRPELGQSVVSCANRSVLDHSFRFGKGFLTGISSRDRQSLGCQLRRISVHCMLSGCQRQPRGRKTIAQHFSAGSASIAIQVPAGTTETTRPRLCRPCRD